MAAKINLSEYTIRLASPAQDIEQLKACHVPWGRGRTWDEYFQEGLRFQAGEFARDRACSTWVLVKRDDYDGSIYTGLRTLRRKALIKRPGMDEIEQVVSYGIFGVVTPEQHRGKGLANHLLKLLHYQLVSLSALPTFPTDIWGSPPPSLSSEEKQTIVPPGISSILSSGIGSSFYEKATIGETLPGWVVPHGNCQQITWKLRPSSDNASHTEGKWQWIYPRDLPHIGQTLSERLQNRMKQMEGRTIWSPDPASPGILAYAIYSGYRSRPSTSLSQRDTEPCGIRFPPREEGGQEAIVLFTIFHYGLAITYIDGLAVEDLPVMLRLLDERGGEAGSKDARVWGVSLDSDLARAWADVQDREVSVGAKEVTTGDLLAVAWYGAQEDEPLMADTQMWCWMS